MRKAPFSIWLLLAVLFHGAAWFLLQPSKRQDDRAIESEAAVALVELSLVTPIGESLATDTERTMAAHRSTSHESPARSIVENDRGTRGSVEIHDDESAAVSAALPSTHSQGSGGEPSSQTPEKPSLSPEQLGIGSSNPFIGPPSAATMARADEKRLEKSVQEAMMTSDVSHGITRSGAIVVALREVTRQLPQLNGSAELMGTVNALGVLVSLEPASVSSDFSGWQQVAKRTLAKVKNKRLRVPQGGEGLRVRFRVSSRVQLPSGHDPGLGVSVLGVPVKKGEGERSASIDILKPNVGVDMVEVPNPGGGDPLRLPQLRAGIGVLGVGGDPADIGSTPRQVVHVQVLEEKPL